MLKLTRWTTAHRRIVVVAWIVLAVVVLAVSQAVGKRNANNFSLPHTDSQRAIDLLQEAGIKPPDDTHERKQQPVEDNYS